MSNASVNSSKREDREKMLSELVQEVESIRALNSSLQTYLEHLRVLKKNILATTESCQELGKINTQWIDTLNLMK